ncbi:MAG: DUF2147 domain-containing protein [Alphaproteobacteria bacterium]|nr:DUF2147 domain-containing protein [Alphaproteobacteria bacterium]
MIVFRFVGLILLFALSFSPLSVSAQDHSVSGLWRTEDKEGIVEIYPCDEQEYCGRFYWLQDDSAENPSLDENNPNLEQKNRPLCGLTFMGGFSGDGNGAYTGGWIYSIRHGATFSASLHLVDADTLELHGFVFIPWLGGSQRWTRVSSAQACHGLRP